MTVLFARCSEAKDMQYFDFHEAFKFYILSNIVITRYEYKIYKIIIDIVYIMYIYIHVKPLSIFVLEVTAT